ncbi:MAG TPA: serine hydroxymethyltransferase [Candidatus Levybacteria bacterium]|nr:serine hydroxymethyltransferase [Candidatus Levybacteria bacterium]
MKNLKKTDPTIYSLVLKENKRLKQVLEMIPSENYTSRAVMETLGTDLTNKYSEGYAKKRYYQGNAVADEVEILAMDRAKKLFGVPHVNVQPYSGTPANLAVYLALLTPGKDKVMGLNLAFGGHLTHGASVSAVGKFFKTVTYELDKNGQLDFKAIEAMAVKERPKIIVCGFTAYPRTIDFEKFAKIARKVDAYLLADISHIAGLVAGGAHPSPVPYVDVVMTTTHKTLRGPRGAMIMVTEKGLKKDPEMAKKIDAAVFPGLQGGPHDNQTAAIAVAMLEASKPSFKKYAHQVVDNAKALADELIKRGFNLVGGGTDNHLILIDLSNKGVNGALAAYALEQANIVTNKNAVPNDPMPPFFPSGLRIGTPGITTRGMKARDMKKVADWYDRVVAAIQGNELSNDKKERIAQFKKFRQDVKKNKAIKKVALEVKSFTAKFPTP